MHAAKHFDPQIGIDIHMTMLGPLGPFPLPTAHLGIVLDPFDYIPVIGGTVQVNGVKRATAGTGGLDLHIPLGIWMPPAELPAGPQWDDELFMGSMTVVADGDPLSRIAMPVLDCNIVGLINPFRLRKPKKPQLSMSLPTAVNLAIPNTVFVGGPPMISIMGMAFKGLFAGLGRLARTKFAQRIFEGAKGKWSKLFANMEPGFLKCKVLRAEPVDIRTGAVSVTHEDFSIPGRLPLAWVRRYRSDEIDYTGVLGPGWMTPADIRLEVGEEGVIFRPVQGPPAVYERLPLPGEGLIDPIDGARLSRVKAPGNDVGDELHVRTRDDVVHVFAAPPANVVPLPGQPPRSLRIERIEDRCGNAWTFERDGDHITRIAERGLAESPGRFISVAGQGSRIHSMSLHDPVSGQSWPLVSYRQDTHGDLVAALDALDAARTFEYRGHRMVRHTDRVGLSFQYAYDEEARVVRSWGDGGLYDYRFAYHGALNETEVTDSLGNTSLVKFSADGLPLCEIDALGGCTFFEYDDWGRTTAVTDPMGSRTEFRYDATGNLLELRRPDGSSIATTCDGDNKATAIVDAAGGAWHQHWNPQGLLIQQITPLGASNRFEYNGQGQLEKYTNARGAMTKLDFDHHGQLKRLTTALGHTTSFEHDASGRLLYRTDVTGRTTRYEYDRKGRLLRVNLPGGASVECMFDAEDQLTRYVDEAGATTELVYFGIGRIAERRQPDGNRVRYVYDTEEQLGSVINQRGESYRLRRDPLGRIVEEVDYWDQSRRYRYDAAGRITHSIDPLGQVVAFATDKLGRVVQKVLPDRSSPGRQTTERFGYDKAGRLVELRSAASHVRRRFDADGRLVEEEQNGFKVENRYDAAGNRTGRKTSAGNTVVVAYDLGDQMEQVTLNDEAPITITRNAMGQAVEERLSPQLSRVCEYDADGLLTAHTLLKEHSPVFETRFDYDRGGNLVRRSDSQLGTDVYTYDPMGRVLGHVDPAGEVRQYLHDPAGDRLRTRVQEVQVQQAVGGPRQAALWTREGRSGDLHYIFDRAGNLVTRRHCGKPGQPELQLEWDANQRLVTSRWHGGDRDGQTTAYAYDPLGRRVLKRNATHTTHYFWDRDALLAEVQQVNEPVDEPRDRVLDFAAAKAGKEKMRRLHLHLQAREYVYRPGTFEPLALIDRHAQRRSRTAPLDTQAPIPDPSLDRVSPSLRRLSEGPTADNLDGLGTGARLGVPRPAPDAAAIPLRSASPAPPPAAQNAGPGLGLGTQGLGKGLSLAPGATTSKARAQADAPHWQAHATQPSSRQPHQASGCVSATVFYYLNDPNGCPTRLTTPTGTVVWSASYAAWGQIAHLHVDLVEQPLRLQGQQEDEETGLHYNRFRYFEPGHGAYIGSDPLGLAANENFYGFGPNTFRWIDPLGLRCVPKDFGLSTIADDPAMLRMWNNAMREAASSARENGYQRYLRAIENGSDLTQEVLEDAFGAVNSRFMRSAREAGHDIAQVHHWNYPKTAFSNQIVDPRHLVPVDSRAVHEQLHRATSSTTDIWSGPIAEEHVIHIPEWSTPLGL